MKKIIGVLAVVWPVLSWAGDDDDDIERVTGKAPPPLDASSVPKVDPPVVEGKYRLDTVADVQNLEYDILDYQGSNQLGMEPKFVHGIREGLELLFLRDYKGVTQHFAKFEADNPNSGVLHVSEVLVWQARMLENFDYRYEAQYVTASAQARAELDKALEQPGNEAWEHFLVAGIAGIESIHTMRRLKYLKALQLAFEAVDEVQKVRSMAPGFTDLLLADGMYNYWRTVVTMNSSVLPDFGDHRAEGIEQMKMVESKGIFLSAPARLSLVFTWTEEGDMKKALTGCINNRRLYPDNVINNVVTGTTLVYSRQYDQAITVLDDVFRVDPDNDRAHYWKGLAYMRSKRLNEALTEFQRYAASPYLEPYQRSHAHYRIGGTYFRQKNWAAAHASYTEAVKIDGHEGAKDSLDRLNRMKKEGKITF